MPLISHSKRRFYHDVAYTLICIFQVYCRVRPLDNPSDAVCIKVIENDVIQLASPEVNNACYYTINTICL